MQRVFAKDPNLRLELKEKFKQDDASRAAFILRSRGLVGEELKSLVKTVLTESTTETNTLKRKEHVEYLDEVDLKKRLVDKPDQVQRIIDNGPSFEHPETKAQMYTLRTFTQEHTHSYVAMY
jgi:hypothetical protein